MTSPDYRSLFQHAGDGIVVVDASHRVIEVNEAFARMVGRDRESLVGTDPSDNITCDDVKLIPLQTVELARTGSVTSLRRLRHASGGEISVEIQATNMPDGTCLGIIREVRQRSLAFEVRSARAIAESLNMALVVSDVDNRTLYGNGHLASLTGFPLEEMMGRDLADFVATDADRATIAGRMSARREGKAETYDIEHRRKDGSSFTAAISASPMFDEEARVIGSVAVIEDVTERRRLQRGLADRERRYRTLFEVTPLPTWVFDLATLHFCAVNPAAVEQYGYSEEEFLAMSLLDIRTPEEALRLLQILQRGGGLPIQTRVEHRKKDGTIIQVELAAEDLVLDGRRSRIVVARDISDEIRLREQQRIVEEHLRVAQKMEVVGGLAGGVAHDFNNLLSVILGASDFIAADLPADSPLQEDVKDIREAAERGAALTRQLLSLGRKEVRAPELLDLNAVVGNVSRLLFRALGPKVHTEVKYGDGALAVVADAAQVEQVLVNLAINARDAMLAGGILEITTELQELGAAEAVMIGLEPGEYVTLAVRDYGTGMDATTRAKAFEPFFTTKGPHDGTGLGLSTVYGIARQSGGAVTLDSAPGEGTRVTLYLPRAGDTAPAAVPVMTTGEVRLAGRRGRVLLVEDEPRVRAQARRLLERSGFAVTDAHDGVEALFQFQACGGAVDVVVSDVMMPAMGGVEMIAKLRATAPTIPVVFVSGYTADDRALPLDERTLFLPKPYKIADLCDAIDSLLAS